MTPERARLGFADAASAQFAFLLRLGFRLVELTDTIARYEGDRRVVRVFHGRDRSSWASRSAGGSTSTASPARRCSRCGT